MPKSKTKKDGMLDTWGRRNRKLSNRVCPRCGKEFRPIRGTSRYCSRPCQWANNGGHNKKTETWWKNERGYIDGKIWLPDGTQIRVKQHRFIMEGIIGRPLLPTEDVHHIDGDKSNNEPGNLMLIDHGVHSTKSNNNREHKSGYKLNLTDGERKARSLRAISLQLSDMGRTAIKEARS